MKRDTWVGLSITGTGIGLFAFIWFAVLHVFGKADFGSVALLILVGLAAFIGLMNVLSFSAKLIGIINKNEPFGLPDGTVRAILTMAFIVLVGVLASFLLTNSSDRAPYSTAAITAKVPKDQLDAKVRELSVNGIVSLEDPGSDTAPAQIKFFPRQDYRLADDVAKQVLTMLSTILAAMIGFYFGAQTPGSGQADDTADRNSIKDELKGFADRAEKVRTAADAKLKADPTKQAAIDSIKTALSDIDDRISAARRTADDNTVPIGTVRAALTDAKKAAEGLAGLQAQVDAA